MSSDSGIKKHALSNREKTIERFISEYKFSIASSAEEINKALSLRHEVFLKELNYEMHEDAEKTLEFDKYDNYSIHCLIEHKRSGIAAGCVRLVLPPPETSAFNHLPVEEKGDGVITHPTLTPKLLPKSEICEVSRLAISRRFRTRKESENSLSSSSEIVLFSQDEAQTFSLVFLGLFLCTYSIVGLTNRRHVFAMMEPRLPRLLAISGFRFTKVSDAILYHGIRHAYYINYLTAQEEMSKHLIPLYEHIEQTLRPQIDQYLIKNHI